MTAGEHPVETDAGIRKPTATVRAAAQPTPSIATNLPPRPASVRYQSFDIWRGIACLMLAGYHSTFYADHLWQMHDRSTWSAGSWAIKLIGWLWVGVPMFFVISGYCIAASIDSLRRKPHSLRSYVVRRIRRIYPPLWIMLGIAVCFTLVFSAIESVESACEQLPKLSEFPLASWIGNLTASESWLHRLAGSENTSYLMPNTWTLCYEEQFYLVTGLILAASATRFFTLTAVVTATTFAVRHICRYHGIELHGFFFDGHWLMFASGILVYHSLSYGTRRGRWAACGTLALFAVYAFLDRRTQPEGFQRHLDEYLFISSLFGIALIVFRRLDRPIAELRCLQPLAACGRMSYSVYLTHYLLVVVVSSLFAASGFRADADVAMLVVPTCLLLSIPPAIVFHRTVEKRFMNAPSGSSTAKQTTPIPDTQPPVAHTRRLGLT